MGRNIINVEFSLVILILDCEWVGLNLGVTIIDCKFENGTKFKPKSPKSGIPIGCTCKVACEDTKKNITGLEFELNTCTLEMEGKTNYTWRSTRTKKVTTGVFLEQQCDIMRTIVYKEQKIRK